MAVSIQNLTRRALRGRRVFSHIAEDILPGWDISLVFVLPTTARALNKRLRRKTYVPNVLSYSLSKRNGEVIICPEVAKRQAPEFTLSTENFIRLLFIHALLHIKGWSHGVRMDKCEQKLLKRYETAHRNRH